MRDQGIFSLKEIYLYPLKQLRKFPFYAPVKPLASFSVAGQFLGRLSGGTREDSPAEATEPLPAALGGYWPLGYADPRDKGATWGTEWIMGPCELYVLGVGMGKRGGQEKGNGNHYRTERYRC